MVMKAQDLEQNHKYEKAIKCYIKARKMFEKAEIMASFIGDKAYEMEAKVLIKRVDEKVNDAKVKDFYRGGIDW